MRWIPWLLLLLLLPAQALLAAAPTAGLMDRFAFDCSRCILDEEHFGIVNGRATAGVQYHGLTGIHGLWAPPWVSSDFALEVRLWGRELPAETARWLPYRVDRSGQWQGVAVRTVTALVEGEPGLVLQVELTNRSRSVVTVPVTVRASGSLDRAAMWEFPRPASSTPTTPSHGPSRLLIGQGGHAIALSAHPFAEAWTDAGISTDITLQTGQRRRFSVAVALGPTESAGARAARLSSSSSPLSSATRAWERRAADLLAHVPTLEASDPRLTAWYNRSLAHFLTNRWNVPGFMLHPYYSTGSIKGGCTCCYLWNYGEAWEILPLADPAATRTHILQYLKCDIGAHFAFDPISGSAFGPWYPVNQEKIVGSIYHYVMNTGDRAFLDQQVAGKSVLDWVIHHARLNDDPSGPVRLIDYGPSNSHLELRKGLPYNHVMPDLNGRRYAIYLWAADLARLAGRPDQDLRRRAADLKELLKRDLWDPSAKWYRFIGGDGKADLRYTVQVFKLFGSGVLDHESEAGLLGHLNDREFLSAYGLHSMAKHDPAYDQVDIDNGGGGICTSFPAQIIEKLYRAGHAPQAEGILERILWWGDRMPYWGDSIVANAIDYRRDTPLQCTFDSVAIAQCVIFGMFGVHPHADGSITVDPHPPAFSPSIALRGLTIRGRSLDIRVQDGRYTVTSQRRQVRGTVGHSVTLPGR